jgi:hypothetical protein
MIKIFWNIKQDSILNLEEPSKNSDFFTYHLNKESNPDLYYYLNLEGDEFEIKKKIKDSTYVKNYSYIEN